MSAIRFVECLVGCMWVEAGVIYQVHAEDSYGVYVDDMEDGSYLFSYETQGDEWEFTETAQDWEI